VQKNNLLPRENILDVFLGRYQHLFKAGLREVGVCFTQFLGVETFLGIDDDEPSFFKKDGITSLKNPLF